MTSVVQRIKEIKQPHGGFVRPRDLQKEVFSDGITLHDETLSPITVGLAVDYLVRVILNKRSIKEIFIVSLVGAKSKGFLNNAVDLARKIKGLDDESIIATCKIASYDQFARSLAIANGDPSFNVNPSKEDIENIRVMVNRTLVFFKNNPVTVDGFDFVNRTGFTDTVTVGDGDFLTSDCVWDLKVSVRPPTSAHTLQVLMYYLIGRRSFLENGDPIYNGNFQNINKLGIFNPRLNVSYTIKLDDIPLSVISEVEKNVICY